MESATSAVSGVHSESGSTEIKPKIKEEQDVSSENAEKETLKSVPVKDVKSVAMDSLENKEKYEKYAADYTRYLTEKYFSDKTIFGGNIYDVKVTADGQTVKSSRLPPYQSYLDPAGFHDMLMKNNVVKSEKDDDPADTSCVKSEKEDPADASSATQATKTEHSMP